MKKVLSLFVAATIAFGAMTQEMPAFAEEADSAISVENQQDVISGSVNEGSDADTHITTQPVTATGQNNFGAMLADVISQENQPVETSGFDVFSVEMSENTASVSFRVENNCTLTVAIFDENNKQMLAYGQTPVQNGQSEAEVTIDTGEIPQYYVVRAFLIDTFTKRALSEEYTNEFYTRKWQEFLSKTTEDFEEELVYNIDNDKSTNFSIFREDVTLLSVNDETNVLAEFDHEQFLYTIENTDETLANLQSGNVIVYQYDNNDMITIKISEITFDGTTAHIRGTKPDIKDVFAYIKIEASGMAQGDEPEQPETPYFSNYTEEDFATATRDGIDSSEFAYNAASEEESPTMSILNKLINETGEAEHYRKITFTNSDDLDFVNTEDIDVPNNNNNSTSKKFCFTGSFEASLGFKLTAGLTYFFEFGSDLNYFELKGEYDAIFSVEFSGQFTFEAVVAYAPIPIIPEVLNVDFEVAFVADLKVSLTATFSFGGDLGFRVDNDGAHNLFTQPTPDIAVELEGEIFIGLKISAAISLLEVIPGVQLFKLEFSMCPGLKINAKPKYQDIGSDTERHACSECIEGTVQICITFGAEASIANFEALSGGVEIEIPVFPPIKFYCSLDPRYGDAGIFKECPHREYKVEITVETNKNGKIVPVSGATVSDAANTHAPQQTDARGKVVFYVEPGTDFHFNAQKEGYTAYYSNTVVKGARSLRVFVLPVSGKYHNFEYDFYYTVDNNNKVTIVQISGSGNTVAVPKTIGGAQVVAIADSACANNKNVKSVQIPNGVKSIGKYAFRNCSALEKVQISNTIASAGNGAFAGCGALTKVEFYKGLVNIPAGIFNGCSALYDITIPTTVRDIGNYAFQGTAVTELNLHEGLTSMGRYVFGNCPKLTKVTLPKSLVSASYNGDSAFAGSNALSEVIFTYGTKKIPANIFRTCGSVKSVNIPATVTTIDGSAFDGTSISKLTLPKGLTTIGSYAFRGIPITELTLPEGVTTIYRYAFGGCPNLTKVTIPTTLTTASYYGDSAFGGSNAISTVIFTKGIKTIPAYIFRNCTGIKSINIPDSVTSIGRYAFSGTSISELTLPEGVATLGQKAFGYCNSLTKVSLPTTLTSVIENENSAFEGSNAISDIKFAAGTKTIPKFIFDGCTGFTKITIPSSVTTIEDFAFRGTSLTELTLPEGVTSIGRYAFGNCPNLTKVSIPKSLVTADYSSSSAFKGSTAISDVTFAAGMTAIPAHIFEGCTGLKTLTIPSGITSIGHNAFNGSGITKLTIPASVATIEEYAFANIAITELTLPEGVTTLNRYAFGNCPNLTKVSIPKSLVTANSGSSSAFKGSTAISNVTFAAGMTAIPEHIFEGCTSLKTITIPTSVTSIEHNAFAGSGLTKLTIPASVATIEEYAFANIAITELTLPEGVTTLRRYSFGNCAGLTKVSVPKSLATAESVSSAAFKGSTAISDVTFAEGMTAIPAYIFEGCTGITKIDLPSTVTTIKTHAFAGTSIATLTLHSGLETIGGNAFEGTKISSVNIPSSVTRIFNAAFQNCSNLSRVIVNNAETEVYSNAFSGCSASLVIYAPTDSPAHKYATNNGISFSPTAAAAPAMDSFAPVEQDVSDYQPDNNIAYNEGNTTGGDENTPTDENGTTSGDENTSTDENGTTGGDENTPAEESGTFVEYSELLADERYNLYVINDLEQDVLEAGNLVYIAQFVTDENGCAKVFYAIPEDVYPQFVIVQSSPFDITSADVTAYDMVCPDDGGEMIAGAQVVLDDEELVLGKDFELSGDVVVSEPGEYTLTVNGMFNYAGTITLQYEVLPADAKSPVAIGVSTLPEKTEYYVGQKFTAYGGVVTKYFNNGSSVELPLSREMASGFDSAEAGAKTVTVTLDDMTTEFEVTVIAVDESKPFVDVTEKDGKVLLSWNALEGAEKYAVLMSGEEGLTALSEEVSGTNYTVSELTNDADYLFAVKAFVNGEWTEVVNADLVGATPFNPCVAKVMGHSLILGNNIGVNFYMELSEEILADEGSRMEFTLSNGNSSSIKVSDAKTAQINDTTCYIFPCFVSAAEMTDVISAKLIMSDGSESSEFTYSVVTYAKYIIDNADIAEFGNAVSVVEAMLNYGAAAQVYFNRNTDSLANEICNNKTVSAIETIDLSEYKYSVSDNDDDISFAGSNLSLKSAVVMKLYFDSASSKELSVSDFEITTNCEFEAEVNRDGNGNQYLAISGICAGDFDEAFTVSVGGVTVANYSVFSYLEKAAALDNTDLIRVCAAMYDYNNAAEAYAA